MSDWVQHQTSQLVGDSSREHPEREADHPSELGDSLREFHRRVAVQSKNELDSILSRTDLAPLGQDVPGQVIHGRGQHSLQGLFWSIVNVRSQFLQRYR